MDCRETTFLIIGGGIAGVSCLETLTYLCPNEKTILLTESPLIKTVTNLVQLGKSISKFNVEERNPNDLLSKNVEIIKDRLLEINSENKFIITEYKRKIVYKYLCICTGARPKIIDVPNTKEFIIGIRDTESVIEFQKLIKTGKRIAIVGNGGIATEIVYEINNILIEWIIKDKHITSTFIDPGASQFFKEKITCNEASNQEKIVSNIKRMRYMETNPENINRRGAALGPDWHHLIDISGLNKELPKTVNIHYDCEIKEVTVQDKNLYEFPLKIQLTNGEIIECDFLISATGVSPCVEFKTDRDFKLGPDDGLFIDDHMKTSLDNIYAAGDVSYAGWEISKHWFQMRLWTQARQMGSMAGRSMAAAKSGEEVTLDFCFEMFSHVTQLFGYQVVLLGKYNGQGYGQNYEALIRCTPNQEYIKYVIVDGKLQGAILIGETGLEETTENLILNQLDITPYGDDILDPNIDIEDYFD